jgi:hypothetical protein
VMGEAEEPDRYEVSLDSSPDTFHVNELIEAGTAPAHS